MPTKIFVCFLLIFSSVLWGKDENALVQWRDFKVLKTPHFHVFFSHDGQKQAQQAASVLENSHREFCRKLNHQPSQKIISVFLYESQGSFERSPIRSTFGQRTRYGFSEPLKKRIVLWLSPRRRDNVYQLRLGLAQILLFEHLIGDSDIRIFLRFFHSEWMVVGLPLYLAGQYDALEQMQLQDAVRYGRLRPLSQMQGTRHFNLHEQTENRRYMVAVFQFLEQKYGQEKLQKLWKALPDASLFSPTSSLLSEIYGLDEDKLHSLAQNYLKEKCRKKFHSFPERWNKKTDYRPYYRYWDFAVAAMPKNEEILFLSDRNNFVNLFRLAPDGTISSVIKFAHGWTIDAIEGLITPPVCSPNGDMVLLKAQKGFAKYLFFVGLTPFSKNIALEHLHFDDYAGFDFSPDGTKIVFAGVKAGKSRLYLYSLADQKLLPLTDDRYSKFQPRFSKDGSKIVYIAEPGNDRDLFVLTLKDKSIVHLAQPGSDELFPTFTPEGEILFVSEENNHFNLAICDKDGNNRRRLTDVPGSIFSPALSSDGKTIHFAYYEKGRMHIYRVDRTQLQATAIEVIAEKIEYSEEAEEQWPIEEYQTDITTDFALPFLAFNALRVSDYSGLHHVQTQFGIFSGAIFDPGRGSRSSDFDVSFGAGAGFTYTFADLISLNLFADIDYIETEEHAHHKDSRSLDYRAGGAVSAGFDLTPHIELNFGYTLFHSKKFDNHPAQVEHHYWTGGVFSEISLSNTTRRGLDTTSGYRLKLSINIYDQVFASDYNYKIFEWDSRYYFSFYEDHIIMLRLQADIGHEDVPFYYDLAGSSHLRGLPSDEAEGVERWVTTLEYRFPLYRDWNFPLLGLIKDVRAFVFLEAGSITSDTLVRFSDWDDVDIAYSVGGGLRLDYYFLQHVGFPVIIQMGKRIDESESPIFYFSVRRDL